MAGIGKIIAGTFVFMITALPFTFSCHPSHAQQNAPDIYRFDDPEQQMQFLKRLNWLSCNKTQPWFIECVYEEAGAVVNVKGDARNRTLQFSFNMHDAISIKISNIINLIGLPFDGLQQCARQGQAAYNNDYVNLGCKARGFNAIIITLAQFNPPPTKRW